MEHYGGLILISNVYVMVNTNLHTPFSSVLFLVTLNLMRSGTGWWLSFNIQRQVLLCYKWCYHWVCGWQSISELDCTSYPYLLEPRILQKQAYNLLTG